MAWRSSFVPEILLFGLWLYLHQRRIRVSGHMWVVARGEGHTRALGVSWEGHGSRYKGSGGGPQINHSLCTYGLKSTA